MIGFLFLPFFVDRRKDLLYNIIYNSITIDNGVLSAEKDGRKWICLVDYDGCVGESVCLFWRCFRF